MEKLEIVVGEELRAACPQFTGGALYATFVNTARCEALWTEIDAFIADFRARHTTESLKEISGIAATRRTYRACGKDPSRYRPSNEALVRRVVQGKGLYQIDTAVDIVNLASMRFGYSIGGFDLDKIQGNRLRLGIGREGEPYEGIGRGPLNIAGMPVYRDAAGGIGTPTSDHERTKMSLGTRRLLAVVNGYDGRADHVRACCEMMAEAFRAYAQATETEITTF